MSTNPSRLWPHAYHLTWHPYGTWLPGDPRGWHRRGDTSRRPPSPGLDDWCLRGLRYPVVTFDLDKRVIVRGAIEETCRHRGWTIHALSVQHTHVHLVVSAAASPEAATQVLKAWATRHLRAAKLVSDEQQVWARHGSMRPILTSTRLELAVRYVLDDHHAPR